MSDSPDLGFVASRRWGALSPLRYPGGKACLAGLFSDILDRLSPTCHTYVEPFAGGAGAGIALLRENRIDRLVINDLDPAVFAFWTAVLTQNERFVDCIMTVPLTIEEWKRERAVYHEPDEHDVFDLGFAFFYLNRTNRSGVLAAGVIGGLAQQGKYLIDARFNREELVRRVQAIGALRGRITVSDRDACQVIARYQDDPDAFIYIDPPYVHAGGELYMNALREKDHERVAATIHGIRRARWLVTYDINPMIKALYSGMYLRTYSLNYSSHHPGKAKEFLAASRDVGRAVDEITGYSKATSGHDDKGERMSQKIVRLPVDDLRLWTENPRDRIEGGFTDDQIIHQALEDKRGVWKLRKFADEMGDEFDSSELPTIVKSEGTYRVYDGNRRVILAKLSRNGFPSGFSGFPLPVFPDLIPCNLCDEETAKKNIWRKHSSSGSWTQLDRDYFNNRQLHKRKSLLLLIDETFDEFVFNHPELNKRFVADEVFGREHLESIGIVPDAKHETLGLRIPKGMAKDALEEVLRLVKGGDISTRNNRGKFLEVFNPGLRERIQNHLHSETGNMNADSDASNGERQPVQSNPIQLGDDSLKEEKPDVDGGLGVDYEKPNDRHHDGVPNGKDVEPPAADTVQSDARVPRRTPRTQGKPRELLFGQKMELKSGSVNNLVSDLQELYRDITKKTSRHHYSPDAFILIRMGLRLIVETAGREESKHLDDYVRCYFDKAKKRLGNEDRNTLYALRCDTPQNLIAQLQNGAHSYEAAANSASGMAIALIVGSIIQITHGRYAN